MKARTHIFFNILMCLLLPVAAFAKTDYNKYHKEITELSVDDNLQKPEVPSKYLQRTQAMMKTLSTRFERAGMAVDLSERDGLVLMVTVPMADLFMANDTVLSRSAAGRLKVVANQLLTPDRLKLLIVAHSDDSGSESYLNNLTRARADAIRAWIANQGVPVDAVVPYGLGYDEPVNSEQSRKGREANRRVEFYFVPGPVMIDELKAGSR